jgi:hypothetical protein
MKSVKTKPKGTNATSPLKPRPSKSSDLRGWSVIVQFLAMPKSTIHRWAKEGMPVRREGRNVVARPEELNHWLQQTAGEAAGAHVVTPGSDLLKDLRASVAAQLSQSEPKDKRATQPARKAPKSNPSRKS